MTDIILETRDLHRRFTQGGGLFAKTTTIHAVNGVSLQVRRGETFAIVGESGCGKSTLARLLLRLIDPSEGQVIYEGQDLTDLSGGQMRALRSDLQFIFQDPFSSLNPRMSVEAIIAEPLRVHTALSASERRAKVADLMKRVGLRPEMADRYPHEFSGGQRQRICIARALASEPKIIVCDEPTSALDVSVQSQVLNLMSDLREEFGLTYLFISHDLTVVRHMADRIGVLYLGRLVEEAPRDALFTDPKHPYTQMLFDAAPRMDAFGREVDPPKGEIPDAINPPSGCAFHPRCPIAIDRCSKERPEMRLLGQTRVACHRAE